jgi:hypothetical protein
MAAPTPRWAWAGAGATTAEMARVETAASAINVFFMASPFSLRWDNEYSVLSVRNFHIPLE